MDSTNSYDDRITRCEAIIGYVFKSKALCIEALNAAGDIIFRVDGVPYRLPKNNRLAVYGDSVAASYLCGLWLERELTTG